MEKPKRPKKPTPPRIEEPKEEITEYFYPHDSQPSTGDGWDWAAPTQLVFHKLDDMPDPDNLDEDQGTQDWYDANRGKESLTLQQLINFAESIGVTPDKIEVTAIIPHRECDYTYMELRVTRKRSDEELATARASYNETMDAYNAKLADYEEAKASYPRRKAEFELWKVQQKLNELQEQ